MIADLAVQTVNPWWSETTGIYIGAFGGGFMGLLGATLGPAIGVLAPRGKGKTFIFASVAVVILTSTILFFVGLAAMFSGQPRFVWYGPLLIGAIGSIVFGSLCPVVVMRYRQAEMRRMDAESLKRS